MKNIFLILLFICSVAHAQKKKAATKAPVTQTATPSRLTITRTLNALDIVVVASLTLQAQDWAWLVGDAPVYADSTSAANFRKIRDKIRADNPAGWTPNVTVNNLAGSIVMYFYRKTKTANAGEISARYTAIVNAISAVPNLATEVAAFDATISGDFTRKRDQGRTIIMDN